MTQSSTCRGSLVANVSTPVVAIVSGRHASWAVSRDAPPLWALILGGLSTLAIAVVFLGLVPSRVVAYVGMTGLVVASILNVWLRTRQLSSR
jgi:hypothetical protein